ncbi:DNA polymerase Y family protein, partial [Rhizobiaceae sp. 2RAB30]
RVDGDVSRIAVGTSRPLREPRLVRRLFHERLTALEGAIDVGFGFDLVRLSVLQAAHLEIGQADLGGTEADEGEELAVFADRVRARLGQAAVLRPLMVESHIPERAAVAVPFAETTAGGADAKQEVRSHGPADRPIRLFRHPEPVEVMMAEIPEGPPARFRWRRALHDVARAEGPERIAPEWWRETEDVATRDYFRIEDSEGRRYWLFRQGFYGATKAPPRWYMHGVFA